MCIGRSRSLMTKWRNVCVNGVNLLGWWKAWDIWVRKTESERNQLWKGEAWICTWFGCYTFPSGKPPLSSLEGVFICIVTFRIFLAAYIDMCLYHLAEFLATIHLKHRKPPTMQEIQVRSLGREDPLEKEMETHPCILAWEIPWTEEPGGLQSMGSQELGTT